MLKLRTILLYNSLYIILFILSILISLFTINYDNNSVYKKGNSEITGYIHNYEIKGDVCTVELYAKEKVILKVYLNNETFNYNFGDKVTAKGELVDINESSNFNTFDYKNYMYSNKIYYIMKNSKLEIIKENTKFRYELKNFVIKRINSNEVLSKYFYAFILGDTSYIEKNIKDSYSINGISHLFAISGMHVGIIMGFIILLTTKMKLSEIKTLILILLVIITYLFLTDFSSSLLRSGLFFVGLYINKMFYLHIKPVNVLLIVASIILLTNPFILVDVGFQFSFTISFYLLLSSEVIKEKKFKSFYVSLISFLAGFGILIKNFYQINVLSIFLNLLFVPLVASLIFPLILLSFIFPFLTYIVYPLILILEFLSVLLSKITLFILIMPKISDIYLIVYYILITLIILTFKKRYLIIFSIIVLIHSNIYLFNNTTEVIMLDVSQGDSLLIRLANNKGNILIDTGGLDNRGILSESITLPYLKSIGVKSLDYLIITHGDMDHIGEAMNIINKFKVKNVLFNDYEFTELEEEVKEILEKKKVAYYKFKAGNTINISNITLSFINPINDINENENSLAFYTNINGYKFLFTGDMGIPAEKTILENYNISNIDFLKVGHHGSKHSSSVEFLDKLSPKYAMISVGANNKFNHPTDEVIDNLIKRDIKIYRTDICGMVKIALNKDLKIVTKKDACSNIN